MNAICDICGLSSDDPHYCSTCGERILTDQEISLLPCSGWGWLTFRFNAADSPERQAALLSLRERLTTLEQFTALSLIWSQVSQVTDHADNVKILVDAGFFYALRDTILASVTGSTVEFAPVSFSTADEGNEFLRKEWEIEISTDSTNQ